MNDLDLSEVMKFIAKRGAEIVKDPNVTVEQLDVESKKHMMFHMKRTDSVDTCRFCQLDNEAEAFMTLKLMGLKLEGE